MGRLGCGWSSQRYEPAGQPGMLDDVDQLDQLQGAICQIETLFPEICPVESFIDEVPVFGDESVDEEGNSLPAIRSVRARGCGYNAPQRGGSRHRDRQ